MGNAGRVKVRSNRLHPLHTIEWLVDVMRSTCSYPDRERRTGRSTSQALMLISKAIANPHEWFDVRDHHGTAEADRELMRLCQSIVRRLELEHFKFCCEGGIIFTDEKNPRYTRVHRPCCGGRV